MTEVKKIFQVLSQLYKGRNPISIIEEHFNSNTEVMSHYKLFASIIKAYQKYDIENTGFISNQEFR